MPNNLLNASDKKNEVALDESDKDYFERKLLCDNPSSPNKSTQ